LKIHFFDPFANIWPHSYPVARVIARFSELGHDLEVVRCRGAFSSHCVAMAAASVSFESSHMKKKLVCRSCRKRSDLIDDTGNSVIIHLDNEIEQDDLASAKRVAADLTAENWSSIEFGGVPVGRIAAYEVFLTHKIDGIVIPESVWPEFQANFLNTVLIVIVSKRVLAKAKPDRVIVYNSLYALNNAYISVAHLLGIPTFTLQGGPHISRRLSTLTCFSSPNEMFLSTYSNEASDWLSSPSDRETISIASEHLQNLLLGESAFAYSAESSGHSHSMISKKLGLLPERTVLVALLSSEDELFAANLVGAIPRIDNWHGVFDSQNSWIKWLIEFAERQPELDLVIRIHPRLMPNKRENKVAPYARELADILSEVPKNVKVNWPSDKISLYDLMQQTDVVLNRRSSAGLEMMAYGLPVVVPGDEFLFSCPPDICLVAKDQEEYRRLIIKAINDGWSIENTRNALRWMGFIFRSTNVDVIKVKENKIGSRRPKNSSLLIGLWKWLVFVYLQSGFMRSEKLQLLDIRSDLESVDELIDTILGQHTGIHKIRRREMFGVSTLQDETNALFDDLEIRRSQLAGNNEVESPLVAKIRFAHREFLKK